MKEQCFLVRKDRRGRGVTVLSRDKTEVSRGGLDEVILHCAHHSTNPFPPASAGLNHRPVFHWSIHAL